MFEIAVVIILIFLFLFCAINYNDNDNNNNVVITGKEGFVYLLKCPEYDSVYKIGMTKRTPEKRLKELNSATSRVAPMELIHKVYVEDCHKMEKDLHCIFRRNRIYINKEYFNVDSKEVIISMNNYK